MLNNSSKIVTFVHRPACPHTEFDICVPSMPSTYMEHALGPLYLQYFHQVHTKNTTHTRDTHSRSHNTQPGIQAHARKKRKALNKHSNRMLDGARAAVGPM